MGPWTDIEVASFCYGIYTNPTNCISHSVNKTLRSCTSPEQNHHPEYCVCPQDTGARKENEASLVMGYQGIQDPRGHQVRTAKPGDVVGRKQLHFSTLMLTMDYVTVYEGKRAIQEATDLLSEFSAALWTILQVYSHRNVLNIVSCCIGHKAVFYP